MAASSRLSGMSAWPLLSLLLLAEGGGRAMAEQSTPRRGPVALGLTTATLTDGRSPLARRTGEIPLNNITSVAYLATLSIGTPGQDVQVVVDTGSDELWVNPTCDNLGTREETRLCRASGQYTPGQSATSRALQTNNTLRYGRGRVTVAYYTDDVAQAAGGLHLRDLQFGVATHSEDLYEGILGLGYGANANYSTFVDAVAAQGRDGGDGGNTTGRVFSVALGSMHESDAGTLVMGGADVNRFAGRLAGMPILAPTAADPPRRYWVAVDSIGFTGTTGGSGGAVVNTTYASSAGRALLDTGTSLSILPAAVMDGLARDLGADPSSSSATSPLASNVRLYTVSCTAVGLGPDLHAADNQAGRRRTVDFSFHGGAAIIRVPLSEFVLQVSASSCVLGAMVVVDDGDGDADGDAAGDGDSDSGADDGSSALPMLLGATFLRAAYVVFDQSAGRIFMAPYAVCNGGVADLQDLAAAPPGYAGNITGACRAADTLVGGGGGGVAAASTGSRGRASRTAAVLLAALPACALLWL